MPYLRPGDGISCRTFAQVFGNAQGDGESMKLQVQELYRKLQAAEMRTAIKRAALDAAITAENQAFDRYKAAQRAEAGK